MQDIEFNYNGAYKLHTMYANHKVIRLYCSKYS